MSKNLPTINFRRSSMRQLSTQKRFATVVPQGTLENPYVKRAGFGSKPSEYEEMLAKWKKEKMESGGDTFTVYPPCAGC